MSFFYANIRDGVLRQLEELKEEERFDFLLMLQLAIEELIDAKLEADLDNE